MGMFQLSEGEEAWKLAMLLALTRTVPNRAARTVWPLCGGVKVDMVVMDPQCSHFSKYSTKVEHPLFIFPSLPTGLYAIQVPR